MSLQLLWRGRSRWCYQHPRPRKVDGLSIEPGCSTHSPNRRLAYEATARRGACTWCGSVRVVKNGIRKGHQLYRCKDCRHQFCDNGKLPRMRKPKAIIGAALRLYFDSASLPKVGRCLRSILGTGAHHSTVHDWIAKYVPMADDFLRNFPPRLSGLWHVDETVLKFRPSERLMDEQRAEKVRRPGDDWWQWDAIDEGTRFCVGTRISKTRTYDDGLAFIRDCAEYAPRPHSITTDDLNAYPRVLRKAFWSHAPERRVRHDHSKSGFLGNQAIERWHGTLKDRVKPMRGLKSPGSQIPRGIAVDYDFLRPHLALEGRTPAQAAQVNLPFEDGWGDLMVWATVYRTLCRMEARRRPTMG
ncbi:MAG: IS6 family transposase [Methanobacteriota archaeon]